MSIGLIKGNSIIGLMEESSEGTYEAPSGAGKYIRPLEDGIDFSPSREIIERGLLNASPGKETPRMGEKSMAASLSLEARASGTEGTAPDYDKLLKSALGNSRSVASNVTSKNTTHTSTVIYLDNADKDTFNVGDIVLVKESGSHEVRPITAVSRVVDSASITLGWALEGGAPANSVVLSKLTVYYTANSGHPSLSLVNFWGNEIEERAIGMKVAQMALEGFEVGQVPKFNFSLQGMSFYHGNGAAAHTPTYDSGLPPIVLGACVWRSGTKIQVPSFSMSLVNTLSALRATCNADGKVSQRVVAREISGSISPYKDDTTFGYYTDWVAGTEFSLFALAYIPAATAGEITMGSVVGIWLPQCVATGFKVSDVDGVLVDELSWKATRGAAGDQEECYIGLI